MFLSPEDVERLTGKVRPSAQARWLDAHGWRHTRSADGSVVVHEDEARRQLCGGSASRRQRREEPDLEALFNGR